MYAVFIGGCLGHFCCTLAAIIFGAAIAKKVSMTIRKYRCYIDLGELWRTSRSLSGIRPIFFHTVWTTRQFKILFSESLWWSSLPRLFSLYVLSCCYWWKRLDLSNIYQIQENALIFFLICKKLTDRFFASWLLR